LPVAVVSHQGPDLFAAVTPAAGVPDMLRYEKFTSGPARRFASQHIGETVPSDSDEPSEGAA
jgi:hypothetical protein